MSEMDQFIPNLKLDMKMFFDESNNIKKGILGEEQDNNKDLENVYFVLGGIALKGELNFNDLLRYVGARQEPKDAKFKFFAFNHTDFVEAIAQIRLRKFFEYLLNNNIYIHYSVMHYMHFALTDILDSLIEEDDVNQKAAFRFYRELQSDMTEVLYKDYSRLHKLLIEYQFPNIKREKANDFINEIFKLYSDNLSYYDMYDEDNFTKELLRQIIKSKKNKDDLLFLEDNAPLVIADSVFMNYLIRMKTFDTEKVFDFEKDIKVQLETLYPDYEQKFNMIFQHSSLSREIQISDVICGFIAKFYNFLSHHDEIEIVKFLQPLDKESETIKTLNNFILLVNKSNEFSKLFHHVVNPLYMEYRFMFFEKVLQAKIEGKF